MISIKIENFEGPLDLLVHLVVTKKINIKEIKISDIIDEYLEIIQNYKDNNFKLKVEFLEMATHLLEIKAFAILRKEQRNIKEEELEKRILEYKIFQEISQELLKHEKMYYIPYRRKNGEKLYLENIEHDNSRLTIENLKSALAEIYKRVNKINDNENKIIIENEDDFNIEESYKIIRAIDSKSTFSDLLKGNFSRNRIVCIFMAILELYKNNEIDMYIDNNEIIIERL